MSRVPLYRKVSNLLRDQYIDGKPAGAKLPSERDLEKHLNVSLITVRAALRELERMGLVERHVGSGTYVAERLESDKDVALLLEMDISNPALSPYYLKLCQEVRVALFKLGISSRPYFGHVCLGVEMDELTCKEIYRDLRRDRISGLISIGANPHPQWISMFRKHNVPLVGANSQMDHLVEIDKPAIRNEIFSRLKAANCRHVAILGYKYTSPGDKWATAECAREHGLECTEIRVPLLSKSFNADKNWMEFRNLWAQGRENPASSNHPGIPDGLIIEDDMLFDKAQLILQETAAHHLTHSRVYLVGSDAVSPHFSIPLTHCVHRISDRARVLAEMMSQRLSSHQEGTRPRGATMLPVNYQIIEPEEALSLRS